MDRYTILKWKEFWGNLASDLSGQGLAGLTSACTATPAATVITLLVIGTLGFGVYWFTTLKSQLPTPLSRQLVLTVKDAAGDTWSIDYQKNQDIMSILNGPVKPGQPLKLAVKFLQKSDNLLIEPVLSGAAGEFYFPGIAKNGLWQIPPKFVLADSSGRTVCQGQFKYG